MSNDRPRQPFHTYDELAREFKAHLAAAKLDFYESIGMNLALGRRQGVYFEDAYSGRRFFNCHCNGGVFNLGHCNPRVTAAVAGGLGKLDIGNHHLASGYRAELARRLSATTGDVLSRAVFAVGGGEASDLAIKLARGTTGRSKVVSCRGGYHGHTGLAMATGDAQFREPFGPNLPGFVQVAFNEFGALDKVIDDDTAAVILEAIPATLGMPIPLPGYFAEVRRLCSERGACLIIDEIQTGLGRTGKMWSYQYEGFVPDALLTGKGLSGGIYPIAATLVTPALHAVLDAHPFAHISTFGGSELGCLAALAVLDIVEEPGFLQRVASLAERFARELAGLPFELRQRGLFMGFKFPSEMDCIDAFRRFLQSGVFAFPAGNDRSVLQFLPPLILGDDEAGELVGRVRGALA